MPKRFGLTARQAGGRRRAGEGRNPESVEDGFIRVSALGRRAQASGSLGFAPLGAAAFGRPGRWRDRSADTARGAPARDPRWPFGQGDV